MSKAFFYGISGGNSQGPLDLKSIIAAVDAGRLPEDVQLSPNGTTWIEFRHFREYGELAPFYYEGKVTQERPEESILEQSEEFCHVAPEDGEVTITSVLRVIGWIAIVGGGLLAFLGMVVAGDHEPVITIAAGFAAGASLVISGILFLAFATVINRLTDISEALKNQKGERS